MLDEPASQRSASQRQPRVLQQFATAMSARENAAAVYRSASAGALQQSAAAVCWGEKNNTANLICCSGLLQRCAGVRIFKCCSGLLQRSTAMREYAAAQGPRCSAVLQRSAKVRNECSSALQMLERFAAAVRRCEKPPACAAADHRGKIGGSVAAINALFTYIYAGLNLNWCWF